MQLPADLDALLCMRYPALFADRHADPDDYPMGRGFEIGPGWFALVDTLSALLSAGPPYRAVQVKSKFGRLGFHLDASPRDPSAVTLARGLSMRVCEVSGRPGRRHCYRPTWIATLAPGVRLPHRYGIPEAEPSAFDLERPGSFVPPIGFALEEMTAVRADVLAGRTEIPAGWHDLADTVLQILQNSPGQPRVVRMRCDDAGLRIEWHEESTGLVSLSELATALSRRIDRVTGVME